MEPGFWADAAATVGQLLGRLPVWLKCTKLIMELLAPEDNVAITSPVVRLRVAISPNSGCINTGQQEALLLAAWAAKPSAALSLAASNGAGEIVVRVADAEVVIRVTEGFLASCMKSASVAGCFNPPGATQVAKLAATRVAIAPPAL
ncbi:MAG: hypothetical protein ACKO9H_02780 [Planctomycetota bacterium]